MTELKTLKDFEAGTSSEGYNESHLVSRYQLKAEAVKWVKWHKLKPYRDKLSITGFIEHFFNLTEEAEA